ncbi:MAG: DNA primase [Bdellovibrionales bacterium]|nr:DNA primase [Bdellovibrionales bacterium]
MSKKGRFSSEWIAQLKSSISLIDIARENIELKKSGNRYMGRCPFHGDRTPSFSVNKDFYYCFGCKETGDIISFMTKLHGLSFEEACEDLAEKANIQIPESAYKLDSAEERAMYERRKQVQQAVRLNYFASFKYYHQNLIHSRAQPQFQEARDYLKERGISQQTIEQFQVGVAGQQTDGLTQFFTTAKAPLDIARQVGLIRPSTKTLPGKTAGDFDLFRERVLFPLIDARGRVCGFGGRLLPSVKPRQDKDGHDIKLPKYLNSTESDLFQKSKFLYGLYQAKVAIREEETVMVVEGYFDVIALHQFGFTNVVATCGTSLTDDHFKTLSRLAKRVIVFFDQDEAGQTATVKAMELGLKQGVLTYGIQFEGKLDPDEFLLESPDNKAKMQTWIAQAIPTLDQLIERTMRESEGDIEARSQAIKQIVAWLAMFTDPVGKSLRAQQFQQKYQIPSEALRGLGGMIAAPNRSNPGQNPQNMPQRGSVNASQRVAPGPQNVAPQPQQIRRKKPLPLADRQLLQYLVKFNEFGSNFAEARKQLPEKDSLSVLFEDSEVQAWVESIAKDPSGFARLKMAPESVMEGPISQELRSVIMEGLLSETVEGDKVALEKLLRHSTRKAWARFSHQLKAQMADADARQDTERFKELSEQFLDLQRKLKDFEESYVE